MLGTQLAMVRRSLILAAGLLGYLSGPWCSVSGSASYPDIEILHESSRTLEFVYRPAAVEWSSVSEAPGDFSRVRVAHTTLYEVSGEPQLPVRLIYFGLPPGGDFTLTVQDQRRRWRPNVRLRSYVPLFPQDRRSRTAASVAPKEHDTVGQFPDRFVRRLPLGWLRSQRIGGIAVFPVIYHPGERRAEVLESITIRLSFTGGDDAVVGPVDEGVFDRIFSRVLLNHQSSVLLRKKPEHSGVLGRRMTEDPFGQAHIWHKLRTGPEGIYRLTYAVAESLNINPRGIEDPRQIRVFYGGGKTLPVNNADTLPTLREIALLTWGFDDGNWDPGDYLEFYGQNLHRWEVQPETAEFVNARHPFEEFNVYWLTPSANLGTKPHRITEQDASLSDPTAMQVFAVTAWAHHEENSVLRLQGDGSVGDYYIWYWQNGQTISISTYNAVDADTGSALLHVCTYSRGNPLQLSVNGVMLDPIRQSQNNDSTVFLLGSFSGATDLRIVFEQDMASKTYLDSYDLEYRRQLKLRGGRLKFAAPDTTATVVFSVANLGGPGPVVWNITDPGNPAVMTGVTQDGTVARFQVELAAGRRQLFWVADSGEVKRPLFAERRNPAALRTPDHPADFLAIGPRHFVEAAGEYLHFMEGLTDLTAETVAIEDVYDNFSWGLVDPLAIRWFLKYAFENWPAPAPQYVLLIGDGHYDLANNKKSGATSYVPPYLAPDETQPADENFVYFGAEKVLTSAPPDGADLYPDMIVGRWPVKNTEQVRTIAGKISRYYSSATRGPWRNRIALVADDVSTGDCVYGYGNEAHIIGAEYISGAVIPAGFEQQKIYLTEFPFGSTCRSKPEARQAILDVINEGVVLIDYIGHGNPDLWAHEHVLERAADIPKMQNKDRLTVMYIASCENGFFDHPFNEGLAEEALRWPDGGAVATISATRLVFADPNLSLNALVFELLLGGEVRSIGEAFYVAKLLRQFDPGWCFDPPCEQPNDRRYVLFGDPAMRFGIPRHQIVIDVVEPDTLPALGVVTVTGRVTDAGGETLTDFFGPAEFLVRDAFRDRRYVAQTEPFVRIDYKLPGGTIYRGTTPVAAGEFLFSFIVPKDITYGGSTAKIIGYAVSDALDAGGGIDRLNLGGTVPGLTDTTGPAIELRVAAQPLSAGMLLLPETEVTAFIEDTSGVNLTGEPGHAITVTFADDRANIADITGTFAYDPGDFRRGTARFALPADRREGPLTITVKAWDNANNSSQVTTEITLGTEAGFRVFEFLNYPNPFRARTTFYFRTNGVPARAAIQIYTVGGRLIKTIDPVVDGLTVWDGTDELGQKVANGVYLTKLTVEGYTIESSDSQADNTIAEKVQKVVLWR